MTSTHCPENAADQTITVYFNGSCPVCAKEMKNYRAAAAKEDAPIRFVDLTKDEKAVRDAGITPDEAARSLHVRLPDGRLIRGVDSFSAIWRRLSGYRWLARVFSVLPVNRVAVFLYDRLVAPVIYRYFYSGRQSRR